MQLHRRTLLAVGATAAVAGCTSTSDGTADFRCWNSAVSNFDTDAAWIVRQSVETREDGYEGVVPLQIEPTLLDTIDVRDESGTTIATEDVSGDHHEVTWSIDDLPTDYTVVLVAIRDGEAVDQAELHFECEHP